MEQKDYLLREIEKIGLLLRYIFSKIAGNGENYALTMCRVIYQPALFSSRYVLVRPRIFSDIKKTFHPKYSGWNVYALMNKNKKPLLAFGQ